ncbi:hypothetical protein [Thermomonospora umbrina]|uniref:Uncharacterized protein n=1 Tax=Thermomonospora umbrina TaxID=111806 RepID=A0A3D9SJU9_9ACTN|nr:hypothetical protein [Thermomonospora umbrina]REE95977.1 hypothetical protein DFJ69_1396 [Thermomonospora umbrina]
MNDQERASLQQQYPDWYIRRPPTMGCLVATRIGGPLTNRQIYRGLSATLVEDTYEKLAESLAAQRRIEDTLR